MHSFTLPDTIPVYGDWKKDRDYFHRAITVIAI